MTGKVYIVVGGTKGIGAAITKNIVQQGDRPLVLSRTRVDDVGVDHHVWNAEKDDVDPGVFPERVEGLVYCPGTIDLRPFRSIADDDWLKHLSINLLGAVKVLRAVYPALRKADNPSVVLISTVAVRQGMPFHSAISASKGAVEGLVRSLAAEWAPNIRVNCIAPSLTNTTLAEGILGNEKRMEASKQRHPLKRIGSAEEVADLAMFLLSASAKNMTGQVIGMDGGMSTIRN